MNKWSRPFETSRASASPAGRQRASHTHQYFAFLSYSHADAAEADWLHKELERFQVPSALAGKLTAAGVIPKRLTPIFRDRHELAAAHDLGSEICEALAGSHCLIVLCSPEAARSEWTNTEIEEFKRVHPEGCVIAAIVAGEPFASDIEGREDEECFPPALRQKYDRRGRPTGRRAEPLAADLRDSGDGRRLGLLKIVAGMIGVGLDDLVQRDHLRRQRRLATIAGASLVGMIVAILLALTAVTARNEANEQRRSAESLVAFMLGDLKDKLEPIGRLDVLDAVGSRVLSYYAKQDQSELSDDALVQRSKALTLMGEIAQRRGDLNGAFARYREAMQSTGEMVRREPANGHRIFDHAQNVFWVGYIYMQRGRVEDSANAFRLYKRLAERLVEIDPANRTWRLEPIYADNNLGIALLAQNKYREASVILQQMLASIDPLVAAEPMNRAYQDQLSEALAWLSQAREGEGALEEALAHRERQLRLLQQQAQVGGVDAPMKLKMLGAHRAMGRLLAQRGDATKGLEHLAAAARLGDELVALEPANSLWAERRAGSHLDFADLQVATNRLGEARRSADVGCRIADRLAATDPTVVQWRVGLRSACVVVSGRLALATGSKQEADRFSAQAVAIAQGNAKENPVPESLSRLATALLLRGQVQLMAGDFTSARRSWHAALSALPSGVELLPRDLANQALMFEGLGRHEEARAISARLKAFGYDHPAFERERRLVGT